MQSLNSLNAFFVQKANQVFTAPVLLVRVITELVTCKKKILSWAFQKAHLGHLTVTLLFHWIRIMEKPFHWIRIMYWLPLSQTWMENIGGGAFGRPVEQPSYSDPHKLLFFYITSVHSTPFQWFLCKKSSIDWVTHRQKKILLTLSNKWMDSYGATHVYLQVVCGWVYNSVNTGLVTRFSDLQLLTTRATSNQRAWL